MPAVALAVGATAGAFLPAPHVPALRLLLMAAWGCALAVFLRDRSDVLVLCLLAAFAASGWGLAASASARAQSAPLRAVFDRERSLDGDRELFAGVEGVLREDAARRPWGASLSIDVRQLTVRGETIPTSGGLRASVVGSLVAQHADAWRAGRRVRAPVQLRRPSRHLDPGVPDAERLLAWRGISLVGTIKSAVLVEVRAPGRWLEERAAALRHEIRRRLGRAVGRWDARSAAIIVAILIGDRAGLDRDLEQRLQEAGTYHVIAISGGNIAIFAAVLLTLLRWLHLPPTGATAVTMAFLIAYAWLVGPQASVSRATLMAVAYLGARLLDHRADPANALAVAVTAILGVTPLAIADAGLVLTCGATLALLLGAARLGRRLPRRAWMAAPIALVAASACVELALFPVGAFVFSRVTFAGLALNCLAVPLMTLGQMAGLAAIALSVVHPAAADPAGGLAHLAAWGLAESAAWVELAPWLSYRVAPPAPFALVAYYVALGGCLFLGTERAQRLWPRGGVVSRRRMAGTTAGLAALWILVAPSALDRSDRLRVTFLDVGQGDATLLQFPDGRSWLVDAGGGSESFDLGARVVAPALWASGVRRLDTFVLTHGDPDHLGGASSVLSDFSPRDVWDGVPVPPHAPVQALRQQAARAGILWRTVQAGDRLRVGGADVRVWHPPTPDWERQDVRNDDSIVLEVRYGRVSVVLPGDIGRDIERALAARPDPAGVRILKAAHHGSGTSSSREFLDALAPTAVVFSSGRDNPYGHPVPAVLDRAEQSGAEIFRTDRDGAITMETDGERVWVRTYLGRELTLNSNEQ